jgi:hypothetical protein
MRVPVVRGARPCRAHREEEPLRGAGGRRARERRRRLPRVLPGGGPGRGRHPRRRAHWAFADTSQGGKDRYRAPSASMSQDLAVSTSVNSFTRTG